MARKPKKTTTAAYGLRPRHPSTFRRTITLGEGDDARKVQLVFEPGVPLDLTDEEIESLKHEIKDGIICPWNGGKVATPASPTPSGTAEQAAEIERLLAENADLRAQVEELTGQISDLTEPDADDESDDEAGKSDPPLGDE